MLAAAAVPVAGPQQFVPIASVARGIAVAVVDAELVLPRPRRAAAFDAPLALAALGAVAAAGGQ